MVMAPKVDGYLGVGEEAILRAEHLQLLICGARPRRGRRSSRTTATSTDSADSTDSTDSGGSRGRRAGGRVARRGCARARVRLDVEWRRAAPRLRAAGKLAERARRVQRQRQHRNVLPRRAAPRRALSWGCSGGCGWERG